MNGKLTKTLIIALGAGVLVLGGLFLISSQAPANLLIGSKTNDMLNCPEPTYPPLTKKDIAVLYGSRQVREVRVPIKNTSDISAIRCTGVVIMTQEPNYVFVIGDQERVDAVTSLGFTLKEAVESDYKPRTFRARVTSREQIDKVRSLATDVLPSCGDTSDYLCGLASDGEIEWMKEEGIEVETCLREPCPWVSDKSGGMPLMLF
jgi:hypothetical protein